MYRSELLYKYAQEHIRDQDVFPVLVPSYNRPTATLLQKALLEPEFPLVLCIRREQEELYAQYKGRLSIMILDNVSDLSQTRESIVQQVSPYYSDIFMLDDDISLLDYQFPSLTKNGKESMRPSSTCYGKKPRMIDILKMWMCSLMWDPQRDRIALSSIGYKPDCWSIDNANKPNKYNSGVISQCIHINTRLIQTHDIHYKPMLEVGVEDYSYQFDAMSAGLLTTVYKDLLYNCPAINSVAGGCENAHGMDHETRYKMYLEVAKKHYGNHPGMRYVATKRTGFETVKFNWDYWRGLV